MVLMLPAEPRSSNSTRSDFSRASLSRAMSRRDIVDLGSSMITHANLP